MIYFGVHYPLVSRHKVLLSGKDTQFHQKNKKLYKLK